MGSKKLVVRDKGLVEADYGLFAERLQQSLVVLRDLLDRPGFGDGQKTLGAEMELSIVDQEGCAYPITGPCWPGILILRFNWNWIASISSTILPRFPWPELPSVEWSPS